MTDLLIILCTIATTSSYVYFMIEMPGQRVYYDARNDAYVCGTHRLNAPTMDMISKMADREDIVEIKRDEQGAIVMRTIEINYVKQ